MRRKIKLAFIDNDSARKVSFKKRTGGLVKKVRELTILCDVSACIVIYGPGEFDPVVVWPNEEEARRLIQRFRKVPEMERCKKMVTQESYLRERAGKMSNQIQMLLRKNKETVTAHVMRQIWAGKPLEEIGTGELRGVMWMLEEKMKELDRRMLYAQKPMQNFFPVKDGPAGISLPLPTPEEKAGRRDFPPDWMFGDTAAAVQSQPPDQNRLRDFLGGFQDFGFQYGFGNEGENSGMSVVSPSENGYFTGNGNENKIDGLVGGLDMYFGRNYNQEMGIGNNNTITMPSTNCAENVKLGFFQSGSGIHFGDSNDNDNNIEKNGADLINLLNYMNVGYGVGGREGLTPSGVGRIGGNNVNAGIEIEQESDQTSSGRGTSVESGDNADVSYDFGKYWPPFFSRTP